MAKTLMIQGKISMASSSSIQRPKTCLGSSRKLLDDQPSQRQEAGLFAAHQRCMSNVGARGGLGHEADWRPSQARMPGSFNSQGPDLGLTP